MKYRIKHYNYKAWEIQELKTRGKDSKNAGEQYWETIKYPGTLEAAAHGLLDLCVGNDFETISELQSTIETAKHEIKELITKVLVTS